MKGFFVWGFFLMVAFFSIAEKGFSMHYAEQGGQVAAMLRGRKLKEIIDLEDYRPIDPSPSSKTKASTRHGLVQHGTPLMPFIPKPSPPPMHSGIP